MGNGGGGSGDEQEAASNTRKGKTSYHRHTAEQIQQLETSELTLTHYQEDVHVLSFVHGLFLWGGRGNSDRFFLFAVIAMRVFHS